MIAGRETEATGLHWRIRSKSETALPAVIKTGLSAKLPLLGILLQNALDLWRLIGTRPANPDAGAIIEQGPKCGNQAPGTRFDTKARSASLDRDRQTIGDDDHSVVAFS